MNIKEIQDYFIYLRDLGLKREKVKQEIFKSLSLNSADVKQLTKLAIYHLSVDDPKQALKTVKKAILFKPDNENIWFLQGMIYELSKQAKYAFESYYYSYRLGSDYAKIKLISFCKNIVDNSLDYKQKKLISEFEKTLK